MSHYISVNLGFYIKVRPQQIKSETIERVCSSGQKGHPVPDKNSNFCTLCGAAYEAKRVILTKFYSYPSSLLPRHLGEMFFPSDDDESVWLFNFRVVDGMGDLVNRTYERGHEQGANVMEIDPDLLDEHRTVIMKHPYFVAAFEHMQKTYGHESIELKYGVVIN